MQKRYAPTGPVVSVTDHKFFYTDWPITIVMGFVLVIAPSNFN